MCKKKNLLIIFLFGLAAPSFAQHDTTYYAKYSDRLVVALYTSVRKFEIGFQQKMMADPDSLSHIDYFADANSVSGVELNYDKLSLSFGYRSVPPKDNWKKGKTTYSNYGFSFGGAKWVLETSYRRYKGFYDVNTGRYDTTYQDSLPYFQHPSLKNEVVKAKFLYFFNHKEFAYRSAFGCTYRQLRPAASWVLTGNLYYNGMLADSSFIPGLVQHYYGSYFDLNRFSVFGISAGGGISVNLVLLKHLFVNGTVLLGGDSQWRTYGHVSGESDKRNYLGGFIDLRGALGYNGKTFFVMLSVIHDITGFESGQLKMYSNSLGGAFTLGYRFRMKAPGIYKKFQETRLYEML